MKKPDSLHDHFHTATLRVARFHLLFVALYVIQTVVFHASKVITPEVVLWRWLAAGGLFVVSVIAWLIAKNRHLPASAYQATIGAVIIADMAFAAFNVYIQRGYASKSVILFVIPIIVAATLINRSALFATALLAIAVYSTTVISYFVLNFNEGYMSEMYGEIALHSGVFLLTAGLLWSTMHKRS